MIAVGIALAGVVAQENTEPLIRWIWITDHLDEIQRQALQHLYLTVASVAIGFAIAFPLAVLASRRRRVAAPSGATRSWARPAPR